MTTELVPRQGRQLARMGLEVLPAAIGDAGEKAARRFFEFFTANIRNKNTRIAYGRAAGQFFRWCDGRGLALQQLEPMIVAAYVEELGQTVKQHLSAIRMLFDCLVIGQVVPTNPAHSVRGPKYVVKKGKTPVLDVDQARKLFDSIDVRKIVGLRDRALIGVMTCSFARIGAVLGMNVEDHYWDGKRWWFRLHEKGGKHHEVPAHHKAQEFLAEYLQAAGIRDDKKGPLFRSVNRKRQLTERRLHPTEALLMIKRRARKADLPESICCHTCRATGITAYLDAGGTIEKAQQIAAHESPRTTKLYDRTSDQISLDEIERVVI
jgi:site-specific recombinase XerD